MLIISREYYFCTDQHIPVVHLSMQLFFSSRAYWWGHLRSSFLFEYILSTFDAAWVRNVYKTLKAKVGDFFCLRECAFLNEFIRFENLMDCPEIWPYDSLKGLRRCLRKTTGNEQLWKKAKRLFSNFPPLQSSRTQSVQSWVIVASNVSDLLALWSKFTKLQIDEVIFTDRWTFRFKFRCHPVADYTSVNIHVKRHVRKTAKTQSLQMKYLRIYRDNIKCTSGPTSGMLRKDQPFVYCFSKVRDETPSSQRRRTNATTGTYNGCIITFEVQ